jgi:hypothetical protein
MSLSRRKTLALIGGGTVAAATAYAGWEVTREPTTARLPWSQAGAPQDPRLRALSWALLAPNPHNRQPWLADCRTPGEITLYAHLDRLLPHTDPFGRQITIGLGCFLELMRMAAAHDGYRVDVATFPNGADPRALDANPVARVVFVRDQGVERDPLFAHARARRSTKEPYDTARNVAPEAIANLARLGRPNARFGGSVAAADIEFWRRLTAEAFAIEFQTPRTYRESVELFRIGRREIDANPDGIDLGGPMMETLRLAGLLTREAALDPTSVAYKGGIDAVTENARTGMGYVWLMTPGNSRQEQLAVGADWLRVNLAATASGIAFHPMSQALQEFQEMERLYTQVHRRLAPEGGTVQMLARIGYCAETIPPSPRWPVASFVRLA